MRRRLLIAGAAAVAAIAAGAGTLHDVSACGGLVAPNGAVRLARASTAVAWHDGVEHYLTSFTYQGDVPDIGWIVPLPAVPDSVVKGGSWSLQRLAREARPFFAADGAGSASLALTAAPAPAQVVLQTTVDSLDITVIKGSGQAVADWCAQNGFTLNDETRGHILAYASSSPIFLAAKYDTNAARARGFFQGDGTPVLITMHTPRLWVPLEVLANDGDTLDADVFLLTDERPAPPGSPTFGFDNAIPGAPGFTLVRQVPISQSLHDDLAAQKNMEWVPQSGWFTALTLQARGNDVTYDMTVDRGALTLAPMGAGPDAVLRSITLHDPILPPDAGGPATLPASALPSASGLGAAVLVAAASLAGALLLAAGAFGAVGVIERRRSGARPPGD
jgi:uncharacterized protein DUF2330